MSRLHPAFPAPESLQILASQYFLSGQYEQTLRLGQKILGLKDDPETRLLMGKSLFALKKYAESAQILQPLYEASQNREAGKVLALDFYYLEKWPEAVAYLEKLLQEGTELSLLNLAAECYLKLDFPAKALLMIEKSLKLEPNQPQARKLEEIIKARLK